MRKLRHRVAALLLCLAPLAPLSTAAAKDVPPADVGVLTQALSLLDQGKAGDARQLAKAASDPLVLELVTFFDLTRSGMPATFADLGSFLDRHPDWPSRRTLAVKAEAVFPSTLEASSVAAWFDRYPPATGQGAFLYVDALATLGRTQEAQAQAQRLWRDLPLADAQEGIFLQRYGGWLTADDEAARVTMLLDRGIHSAAEAQAKRAGGGWPELAAARIALQDRDKGAPTLVGKVPAPLAANDELLFDLAVYQWETDRFAELEEHLNALGPANAGDPAGMWIYRFALAGRLLDQGKASRAYRIARDNGLADGLGFAELEWLAGHIALRRLNDPASALAHFARYHDGSTSPISKGKGAFWAALAAEQLGRGQEARQWLTTASAHDTGFYGQLAAARLGLTPGDRLPAMPARDDATYKALADGELARAAKALDAAGDRSRSRLFFHHLLERGDSQAHFLAAGRLAQEMGRWDLVIDAGKEARSAGILLIDYLFPMPPLAVVEEPEMALVLAVIRQESEFDQNAVSRAGAKGLMQLMPATAKGVARGLGLEHSESKLTDDPDYNVTLGSAYLTELLTQFDGSYLLTLAGYNAGPHRATSWIERNGDPRHDRTDVIEWIEAIPFYETRNYVMRVAESVVVYRHLLGEVQVADWEGYNPVSDGPDGARLPSCCN